MSGNIRSAIGRLVPSFSQVNDLLPSQAGPEPNRNRSITVDRNPQLIPVINITAPSAKTPISTHVFRDGFIGTQSNNAAVRLLASSHNLG